MFDIMFYPVKSQDFSIEKSEKPKKFQNPDFMDIYRHLWTFGGTLWTFEGHLDASNVHICPRYINCNAVVGEVKSGAKIKIHLSDLILRGFARIGRNDSPFNNPPVVRFHGPFFVVTTFQ